MVSSNSPNTLFFVMMISILFFLTLSSTATALNFNIPNITTADKNVHIKTYQDADISPDGLQLTPDDPNQDPPHKAGRATYIEPLHLWDNASGKLTDFNTHFIFVIQSEGYIYGDGLTFFLVPNVANVPARVFDNPSRQIIYHGSLGLPSNKSSPTLIVYAFLVMDYLGT